MSPVHHRSTQLAVLVAKLYATPEGAELLAWMRAGNWALTPEWIDELLAAARAIWSTGGAVKPEQQKTAATSAAAVPD